MKTMTFGQAIEALKQGEKVARAGWNGKGMFLWLKPAAEIKTEWCKDPMLVDLCEQNGGTIQALGTICMFTHDSTGRKAILTGWLASQSDMLLEDWYVVNDTSVNAEDDAVRVIAHRGLAVYCDKQKVLVIDGDNVVMAIETNTTGFTAEALKAYVDDYLDNSRYHK